MRCYCCNVILTPQQATRKFKESETFVDMCDKCLGTIADDVDTLDSDTLPEIEDDENYSSS